MIPCVSFKTLPDVLFGLFVFVLLAVRFTLMQRGVTISKAGLHVNEYCHKWHAGKEIINKYLTKYH